MVAPTSAGDGSGSVAVGTVLADRYRIDGVLGTGGMGHVYRGEHVTIRKPVAIKVLHAALGKSQEATLRFQREALASGRLDHPNIVGALDFGTLDDGRLYLVMEALEGEDLGRRLDREKRIPWAEALGIIRGVLLGLRHAHDRGVVHRDIKPDNIFLATKGGETVVKILDFGIAKLCGGETDDRQATRAGITVGTPKYLSPEQAVGGAITPAADVYSTSVVLYELLVGRVPFDSEDALTLLTAHAGGDVPAFHDLAPDLDVPERVEALVRHGLAKLIAERISSADYVEAIEDILRVAHPSSSTIEDAPPAPSRRARRSLSALVLGAAVAGAVAFAYPRRAHTSSARPVAVASATDARQAPASRPRSLPRDHDAQLAAQLHVLQYGATCAERKKAVAKLLELDDRDALPALKKARARGNANTCLRASAGAAIKTLASK
jgi:serine/threonine-protein kinase